MKLRAGLLSLLLLGPGLAMATDKGASSQTSSKTISSPVTREQPPVEMGEQWTPQDSQNADEIIQFMAKSLVERTGNDKIMHRPVHSHHHGCAQALVQIDPQTLPPAQRVGIYANSKPQKAWVRFSNGDPDGDRKDPEPDVRGMAVKIMNVPDTPTGTQDLVMMNSKLFFVNTTAEYLDFIRSTKNIFSLYWYLLWHRETRQIIEAARNMPIGNPVQMDYYSATAYKLGDRAMHFAAVSCIPPKKRDKRPASPYGRYLRDRLVSALSRTEACFNLLVQMDSAEAPQSVETPMTAWNEEMFPYKKVGTITLLRQEDIEDKQQMRFCEKLSFDPWHTVAATRPLGALNRVRLMAYPEISKMRHDHNKVKEGEPTDFDYRRR